ncbi:hypothetical protein E2F47_22705 [Mycobacterium eburneum]|nr:hypothetical protein [Mycobacterium eburneum]TDH48710.1 hypothetical protein E2F47_22705 [Mycobacterium eburneum]
MIRIRELQEVVDAGIAPSERFLREGIRNGDIPGRRLPRKGRAGRARYGMTDDDIAEYIDSLRIQKPEPKPAQHDLALTSVSRKRFRRSA